MEILTCRESGLTLQNFLRAALKGRYSGRYLKRLIDTNHCRVNGRIERFSNVRLKRGDRVELAAERGQDCSAKVLFEDRDLIVCSKPMRLDTYSVAQMLGVRPVHRLDRDTTGVMVFARTAVAQRSLEGQFARRQVEKRYMAVVDGVPKEQRGSVRNRLGPLSHYSGQTIWGERTSGLVALTRWTLLDAGDSCALLECIPVTGRTHQIRVHLAGIGHPILGDGQYGQRFRCKHFATRPLLHAKSLSFTHPTSGKVMTFRTAKPGDFPL